MDYVQWGSALTVVIQAVMEGITWVGRAVVYAGRTKRDMGACVPLNECSMFSGVGKSRLIISRSWFHTGLETDHESMFGVKGLAIRCIFALCEDVWVVESCFFGGICCSCDS